MPDGWPSHAIFYLLGVAALTRRPGEGRDCDVGLWGRVGGSGGGKAQGCGVAVAAGQPATNSPHRRR